MNYNKEKNNIFKAILSLKTGKEAKAFFNDFCTKKELKAMNKRYKIALFLDNGLTYRKIAKKLNISPTTVWQVVLKLNNNSIHQNPFSG